MIDIFVYIGIALVGITLIPLVRLLIGPTIPDRVVAFDTMNTLVIASMLSLGLGYETPVYIDVAVVYAILSYIATLYIAKYLEGWK